MAQRSNDFVQSSKLDERAKKWQLTENNATYTKQEGIDKLCSIGTAIYAVASSEVGESGTKHIHAFVIFENAIKLKTLKKAFPRAHFERCRGNNASNREYVIKDDTEFYEVGSMPITSEGKQTSDVASEVCTLIIDNGLSPMTILKEYKQYADYVVRNFRNLCEIYKFKSVRNSVIDE